MEIDLGREKKESIRLREFDDPYLVAIDFC